MSVGGEATINTRKLLYMCNAPLGTSYSIIGWSDGNSLIIFALADQK